MSERLIVINLIYIATLHSAYQKVKSVMNTTIGGWCILEHFLHSHRLWKGYSNPSIKGKLNKGLEEFP